MINKKVSPDGTNKDSLFGFWYNNNYKASNQYFLSIASESTYFKKELKSGEWTKVS